MSAREHIEAYIHKVNIELDELKNISWPENRRELESRKSSLKELVRSASKELKQANLS